MPERVTERDVPDLIDEINQKLKQFKIDYSGMTLRDKVKRLVEIGYDSKCLGVNVVVDDGADRWLAERDTYDAALATVIQSAIDGNLTDEGSDAYDALCSECPAMYSCIGSGSYNDDEAGLLALLGETLAAYTVEEIARNLGIEIPEPVDADAFHAE